MDYQFKEIERKWQLFWSDNQTFKVENNSSKPKYYVLDMFPYPSGAGLHVGHPLGYIASDIFARYKRLKGYNVLHPMGYDSFGLPAEQYAIQTGQHPALTTEANIATYRRQLDQIGFSFDWSREVRTSSPEYYKWTQWIFMQLFNSWFDKTGNKAMPVAQLVEYFEQRGSNGIDAVCDDDALNFTAGEWKAMGHKEQQAEILKYRLTYLRESTVNWCAALGTVLANDEVKDGFSERGGYPVEQKKMMQWSMRITAYADRLLNGLDTIDWPEPLKEMQRNWIGKSVGALVRFSLTPALSNGEGVKKPYGYQTADTTFWDILKSNSRSNRQNPTESENLLWQYLRNNQTGYKIRRRHVIDSYIVDFVCLTKGLVIEIDGGYHQLITEDDKTRTSILSSKGFDVLRFSNEEVLNKPENIVKKIRQRLDNQQDRIIDFPASPTFPPQEKIVGEPVHNPLSFGEGRGEAIEVFTTRADTIFGTTFLVLAPEHELVAALTTPEQESAIEAYISQAKKKSELERMTDAKTVSGAFTGSYAINPVNGEQVPVWIADYVLAGYGTGAVMAVPSGDQRDYLFAKQYNLPIIQIMDIQKIDTEADPTKEGRYINSGFINGLTYKEATAAVIAKLEETGAGKAKVNFRMRDAIFGRQRYWGEPVPVYFKEGLPYLIDEKYLPLVLPEVDKYLPTESGEPPLARAEAWNYVASPKSSPKERTSEESDNSLSFGEGWGEAYPYELSTMPGWAGSSFYWYRYMDAHNDKEFASKKAIEYWKDVDLYIGGSEHATGHLLYSRFWNKFLKDLNLVVEEEPFKKLINQGMIQGVSEKIHITGSQNSTTASNIIPIEGFGHMGSNTYRILISDDVIRELSQNPTSFLSTLLHSSEWNVDINIVSDRHILDIDKFIQWRPEYKDDIFLCSGGSWWKGNFYPLEHHPGSDKFFTKPEIEKMSKSKFNVVNPDDLIGRYGADTLRMYEMFLGPLEQSKPWNTNGIEGVFKFLRKFWRLFHHDTGEFSVTAAEPTKAELKSLHKIIHKVEEDIGRFSFNTSVSSFMIAVNELTDLKCNNKSILQNLVIILSPYAPHICEELWELLGNAAGTLSYTAFPEFRASYLVEDEYAYPISINGKTKLNLNISLSLEPAAIEAFVLANADVKRYLGDKIPKKAIVVKGRIVNIVL